MPAAGLLSAPSFRSLFDAIPSPSFLVDADVRILASNAAAGPLIRGGSRAGLRKRGGEALGCLHADETPEGCGHAASCRDCVIRNSVTKAVRGEATARTRTMAETANGNGLVPIHLLVTASPVPHDGPELLVLLILEDISELVRTQEILPICAWCKKIRDDADYWVSVEEYFKKREDMSFSHSICKDCLEQKLHKECARTGAAPPPPSS